MKNILYIIALLAGIVMFTGCAGNTWKYKVEVSYYYEDEPDRILTYEFNEIASPNSSVKTAHLDAYTNVFDNGQRLVTVLVWKYNGSAYSNYTHEREIIKCPGKKIRPVCTTATLLGDSTSKTS